MTRDGHDERPRIGATRRKRISTTGDGLVRRTTPDGVGSLPLVLEAATEGVELTAWAATRRSEIESDLLAHGAILFRGFAVGGVAGFEHFIGTTSDGGLLEYAYASTPRSVVEGRVYTSTEYPADQAIPLHNEMSYARSWPRKLWLHCIEPSAGGGATPIADSRRVLAELDPDVSERFRRAGVQYVRNYGPHLDLPWTEVFGTSERERVETFCRDSGIELEWVGEDRLRTRQTCSATALHPQTGEELWFNQAHLFHPSALPAQARALLLREYGEHGVPRTCVHADGTAIAEADLEQVRAAYDRVRVVFPWRLGDVLMLDNMLVAHGREPYRGTRRIVVGMAEPYGPATGTHA